MSGRSRSGPRPPWRLPRATSDPPGQSPSRTRAAVTLIALQGVVPTIQALQAPALCEEYSKPRAAGNGTPRAAITFRARRSRTENFERQFLFTTNVTYTRRRWSANQGRFGPMRETLKRTSLSPRRRLRLLGYHHHGPCAFKGGLLTVDPECVTKLLTTTRSRVGKESPKIRQFSESKVKPMQVQAAQSAHSHCYVASVSRSRSIVALFYAMSTRLFGSQKRRIETPQL